MSPIDKHDSRGLGQAQAAFFHAPGSAQAAVRAYGEEMERRARAEAEAAKWGESPLIGMYQAFKNYELCHGLVFGRPLRAGKTFQLEMLRKLAGKLADGSAGRYRANRILTPETGPAARIYLELPRRDPRLAQTVSL